MNDPIVDEVRRVRDAHAASFNYDLDAIFRDIKAQEKASSREFQSFAASKPTATSAPDPTIAPLIPLAGTPPAASTPVR
jgi:hypothetical protein